MKSIHPSIVDERALVKSWDLFAWDYKVEPPQTNSDRKTNTIYHMYTLGASKCMHMVHSVGFAIVVGFGWFYIRFVS